VGKYERDEVKPTIDVVKKLTEVLDTTVGYLLGETNLSCKLIERHFAKAFVE
jgi:transcriptional regulator with XRE-family HTH domain